MDEGDRRPAPPPPRVIGKVIKGDSVSAESPMERPALRPPRPGVLNAEEFEARTTSQRIIAEAEARKAEILEEANRQREEVFTKARTAAKAEVIAEASAEIAKAKMQAGQILAAAENDLITLACRIAEKIIGRDLERQPDIVVDICATAIENVRNARAMVLRINPRDGKTLRESKTRLMEMVGRQVDIAFKDDSDVEPGGCIIQTEFGTVDAQLKTQFEMLRLVLQPDTAKKEVK
jgi:type III secretion protein L